MKSIAILLSADSFEKFFGGFFGISVTDYLETYRNDFAWFYAQSLNKLGHNISIYVLSRELDLCHLTSDGISVRFIKLPRWWLIADGAFFRLGRFGLFLRLRSWFEVRAFRGPLNVALASDQIQLLYVQEIWTDRIDFLKPCVSIEVMGADHGAKRRPLSKSKIKALRLVDKITVQEPEQQRALNLVAIPAVLIPNGVDVDFFTPSTSISEEKSILAVGRLDNSQKRISDIILALKELPDFRLDIVGSGPDEIFLRNFAIRNSVVDRVIFHGFVADRTQLREFYRNCGVFCCPSAWEATLIVLLEAMSCGVACVASDIPTLRQVISDEAGLLVPVGEPEKLQDAICLAFQARGQYGSLARKRSLSLFSQDHMMSKLSKYIEA